MKIFFRLESLFCMTFLFRLERCEGTQKYTPYRRKMLIPVLQSVRQPVTESFIRTVTDGQPSVRLQSDGGREIGQLDRHRTVEQLDTHRVGGPLDRHRTGGQLDRYMTVGQLDRLKTVEMGVKERDRFGT